MRALIAILTVTLAVELLTGGGRTMTMPAPMPARPATPPARAERPVAAFTAAILARPLFDHARRPPRASDPMVAAAGLPRLAGTIVGGTGNVAILVADGEKFALRQGASGHGLAVLEIAPGRVVAERRGMRLTLTLLGAAPATRPVAPAPVFELTKDPRSRAATNQDE